MVGPTGGRGAHDHEAGEHGERGERRALAARAVAAVMLLALIFAALPWSIPSVAAADTCLADREPNDTPEAAMPIAGAACVAGQLQSGDQDIFTWTVSEADARQVWTLTLQGLPAQQTKVQVYRITSAAGETPVAVSEVLDVVTVQPGDRGPASATLLFRPGVYLLGVVASGGEGPYRMRLGAGALPPSGDREPNDAAEQGSPIQDAFALSGDLQGSEDWHAWTVSAGAAAKTWRLLVRGPVGASLTFDVMTADGQSLLSAPLTFGGGATFDDLVFKPGTYLIRLSEAQTEPTPYTLEATAGEPPAAGREAEPNDTVSTASSIQPRQALRGRISRDDDLDVFHFTVDTALAATQFDVRLLWRSGASRKLCLLSSEGTEMVCRTDTAGIALTDLLLPAGDYALSVTGDPNSNDFYLLRLDPTSAPVADFDAEPNDAQEGATAFDPTKTMRGRISPTDTDYFRFAVTGEPQLWRVEAVGQAAITVSAIDASGAVERNAAAADDANRAQISDLYLVPGNHWLRVQGEAGDYTLRLVPLGPPDPAGEREPNDSADRAQALRVGETRNGRLAEASDADGYRFFLAATDHVALRIAPPADGAVKFTLEWGTQTLTSGTADPGQPLVYDAQLLPGDYRLTLMTDQPSEEVYHLTLERRDPFIVAADLEPNDTATQARPLPPTFAAAGSTVQFGDDWYALPVAPQPTDIVIHYEGTDDFAVYDGQDPLPLTADSAAQTVSGAVPAGKPLTLRVSGASAYSFSVAYTAGPTAKPAPPLPVTLTLDPGKQPVAAFVDQAQRLDTTLTIVNTGSTPLRLALAGAASNAGWRIDGLPSEVAVAAGERATVPVAIAIDPDAWADQPVRITIRAADDAGAQQTASFEATPGRDAAPLNPSSSWPLPEALRGGIDVAWTALGASALAASDGQDADAQASAFDGMASSGGGFASDATSLPLTLTLDLAGDDPAPVAGILLNPQGGDGNPQDAPRAFDLLLSTDGSSFQPALSGELGPLPIEQAFVLPAPVPARFAQLRIRSNYGGAQVVVGEWKVVAQPGATVGVASGPGVNVADPRFGGHIVFADPQFASQDAANAMLTEETDPVSLQVGDRGAASWVIGFQDDRAARLTELQWVDDPAAPPETRFTTVDVAVSVESPIGPWRPIGTWTLARSGDGVAPLTLNAPTWARFVRFVGKGPAQDQPNWSYPTTIRAVEQPAAADYRSILGEWGQNGRAAIYEALAPPPQPQSDTEAADNDSAGHAQPLPLGQEARGRVQAQHDEDWYRIDVPAGQNRLTVSLSGDPSVDVEATLQDASGRDVPLTLTTTPPKQMTATAAVAGGESYFLRVRQPPHSVAITFDTSMSLGPYITFVFQAVNSFAGDVVAGQEAVNFLPFGADFLLKAWGDQPYALQGAINDFPRNTSDSSAEAALLAAMEKLNGRPGVKAIIVITDADTSSYDQSAKMWQAFTEGGPRIYAVHVASNDMRTQHLMQDWASVNGGVYSYVRTLGEMGVAFDRAATQLRRPTGYALTATAAFVAPPPTATATPRPTVTATPEPTATATATPEPTATPTPMPTIAPTAAAPASIQVLPPAATAGQPPALAPAASGVAVELILDTSGSMLQQLPEGQSRIDVAKGVLSNLVTSQLPPGTPLALRVFGAEPGSCDTNLAVPLGPLDPTAVAERIGGIQVVNEVKTPIGDALELVAQDLADAPGTRIVVLVTDGEETCGGDPRAAIADLAAQGIEIHVNIVGLALDDPALKQQFEEWARLGRGQFFDARSQAELGAAIAQAIQPPFRVIDADGGVVASGVVGGPPVSVPPGAYTIEIESEPPGRIDEVTVGSGQAVKLPLPPASEQTNGP